MTLVNIERLTEEQQYLVVQSMTMMDSYYDAEMQLLKDEEQPDRHDTRGSAHYALGLLIRRGPGDLERACGLIAKVIDLQFDYPSEIYHGTFRTSPTAATPPVGNYDWKSFAPGFAYFLNDTMEKIGQRLTNRLSRAEHPAISGLDPKTIKQSLQDAIDEVLPPVWRSYDPNWREFIACAFAMILDHFAEILPHELVMRMDESMDKAVGASIDRRLSDAVPMNSNIELMHIFIAHYYGHRLGNAAWIQHADREAVSFQAAFAEFGSFAEFNTTTYYGVDLTVLGMWRSYGRSPEFVKIGAELEQGLWVNIALFYNPNLENLSGPFSRAYEMEMRGHSSIGVFLYLALGKGYEYLAGLNCESSHDPLIALVGVDVPEALRPLLVAHREDRRIEKQFRELCERDKPGQNRNLCTAAAWIEQDLMIGAMSGSRNTNGQMHSGTIHWKAQDGEKYYLRLIRREVGKGWNTHLRGINFEARVAKDLLAVDVSLNTELEIEIYFEIRGANISAGSFTPDIWNMPGLTLKVEVSAPEPSIIQKEGFVEVVYLYRPQNISPDMSFTLRVAPAPL
ncbi:hypothetical protein H1230_07180 [Paenibacillus sp. 19GGS1-52]|uniref:hypothetical protein n=1 Tax=Paenibacillus sp. 19GGS1-52 TaxID=2758563 RepID=UPI001EFB2BB1|nr:hypothetical protein [Paenibacillus sp. 19GGS1-52]ULO08579.1 hypothetical protein H1230_07180 [Paenibacillus sp. 19GGS1-52]